jgi:hypothetical protein
VAGHRPLRIAEIAVSALFYISALFSLFALIVEKAAHSELYSAVQIAFVLSVIAYFLGNLLTRLYFAPRGQKRRYEDFLSHAYGTALTHQQTTKYYNNSATTVPTRIAAQVLENSFYSKDTASGMAAIERIKIALYALMWIVAVLNRSTDLNAISVASQIVFSEQLLARWLRLEWLRLKCEGIFDEVYSLIQGGVNLDIPAIKVLGEYEIVKATAGITLSTRVFERNQTRTEREWQQIRTALAI